jgi:DNA mismatch endonuclease (patch repair protein)
VDAALLNGLRRKADLVFTRNRIAVFMDGCYWHGCPSHYVASKTNTEYWHAKIEGNRLRDHETDRLLRGAGWTVIRIWEHEDLDQAAERIKDIVRASQLTRCPTTLHEDDGAALHAVLRTS